MASVALVGVKRVKSVAGFRDGTFTRREALRCERAPA